MFIHWVYSTNHKDFLYMVYKNALPFLYNSVKAILTFSLFWALLNLIDPLLKDVIKLLLLIGTVFMPLFSALTPKPYLITYVGVLTNLARCVSKNYQKASTLTDYICLLYQPFLVIQFIWFYFAFHTILGRVVLYFIGLSVGFWLNFGPIHFFFIALQCLAYSFSNAGLLLKQLKNFKLAKTLLFDVLGDPAYDTYIGHNPTSQGVKTFTTYAPTLGASIVIGVGFYTAISNGACVIMDKLGQEHIRTELDLFKKNNPNITVKDYTSYSVALHKEHRLKMESRNWKLSVLHEFNHHLPTVSELIWRKAAVDSPSESSLTNSKTITPKKKWTWE